MALPFPSSLACSRLRPSGILGLGAPLPSEPDMDMEFGCGCFKWSLGSL